MAKKTSTSGSRTKGKQKAKNKAKDLSFEQALEQLEQIIDRIENGSVDLEEGLRQYGEGMALIRHCRAVLDRAEQQIKKYDVEGEDLRASGSADS
ncbi:MAG: exodeoxyribonuclease VII small subunit [Phycisphaeraceae bacterium]|nr:exodeoxyribonuclease VII small subunit [Phycisphaeraceae bacterium]